MKIKLFGQEIKIEISKRIDSKPNSTLNNVTNAKNELKNYVRNFTILILTFLLFAFLANVSTLLINYKVGDIATNDIIAYKNIQYYKDILDDNIKEKIKKNTTPEYDIIPEISDEQLKRMNSFFDDMKKIGINSNNIDQSIDNYLNENNYNLSSDEAKEIINRENISYVVNLVNILETTYSKGISTEKDFDKVINENEIKIDALDRKFLENFIIRNRKINEEKTVEKIQTNINSLKNKEIKIYKGDIIVKKGEPITHDAMEQMRHLGLIRGEDKLTRVVGLTILFSCFGIILYYILKKYSYKIVSNNEFYPSIITVALINALYIVVFDGRVLMYLLPFAVIPIVLTLVGNRTFAIIISIFNIIVLFRSDSWSLVLIGVVVVSVYKAKMIANRSDLVRLGVFIGIIQAILSTGYAMVEQQGLTRILIIIIFSVISGMLTSMITLALLPHFENTFDILTNVKLLELGDFSHTLLKELLMIAPGTFHHSVMVGALAESAAESIGANATFARVASYYHDIGKIKRPNFFIENQKGGLNPHDNLKPSVSALIIISHTKDGYIMSKKHKLPKQISNIIIEHHGTTLVQYFYEKAIRNGEKIRESDFRYPGPKPKTKESAIILLADTIEAAVRAADDKSRENIERLIRTLIKNKIEDNQLSEADITLSEIEKVVQAFINVLLGAYHQRIKYQGIDVQTLSEIKN